MTDQQQPEADDLDQRRDTSPLVPELDDVPEDDEAEPADAGVDNPNPGDGEA